MWFQRCKMLQQKLWKDRYAFPWGWSVWKVKMWRQENEFVCFSATGKLCEECTFAFSSFRFFRRS